MQGTTLQDLIDYLVDTTQADPKDIIVKVAEKNWCGDMVYVPLEFPGTIMQNVIIEGYNVFLGYSKDKLGCR